MSLIEKTSLKDFETLKILGKGSFSSVYLVKRKKDSKIYALKSVFLEKLSKKQQENSVNEVRILASIHNQNVISYKEAFWDDSSSTLNIIMEYADDGDLLTKIKQMKQEKVYFEEEKIWDYAIQIIQGLKSLHDKNIIHRDLKSENIFLFKKNSLCKIGDMNVSKVLKEKLLRTQTGTPYYASPEVWMNKPYSFKSDLWSIGCVIYEMCELRTPFNGKDMDELFVNICLNKTKRISEKYSEELWLMIKKLLEVNVEKRYDCNQFLQSDIVKNKIRELNNNYYDNNNKDSYDNSMLLNTIIFSDIKDIKRQLPNKKYYNEESTTESNSKKEKENISKDNNTLMIKELRKELANVKYKQDLRKKEKEIFMEQKDILNNNLEKNCIEQKLKKLDIKYKNIQINNRLKLHIYNKKNIIPNNYNRKNIKFLRRNQINEISKCNDSLENIKNYQIVNHLENKNNISYRNINLENNLYHKYNHKFFTSNGSNINNQNKSFSYKPDNNNNEKSQPKIHIKIINTNNNNSNNIHNKLFNKLKFLNSMPSIKTEENKMDNNSKLLNQRLVNKLHMKGKFNLIPNNFYKYINNNYRYSKQNLNNKMNNSNIILNKSRAMSLKEYLNNSKQNLYSKNNQNISFKSNSHKKLLELNIDMKLEKIKSLLSRNKNLKINLKTEKINNNLINHKSFSERRKKIDIINIPKKKIMSKKHLLINQIPKCNGFIKNRNGINIPHFYNQLNTCDNNDRLYLNKNYLF